MTLERRGRHLTLFLSLLAALVAGAGCNNGGSGGGSSDGTVKEKVAVSLGQLVTQVPVAANTQQYFGFTFAFPPDEGIKSWTIDVAATLAKVHVAPVSTVALIRALAASATVDVGLSMALPAGTPCDAAVSYWRQFTVTLDAAFLATAIAPAQPTVSASSIVQMASGPFTICARVTFPVAALITVDALVADVTRTCTQAPQNFLGPWSGSYSCQSVSCSNYQENGGVSLTITHDTATNRWIYVDGPYRYEGSVCGNVFHFVRNDPDEIERGTMTLGVNPNTATKVSRYYQRSNTACYGDCTDYLTRQ